MKPKPCSMNKPQKKYLADIQQAITDIEQIHMKGFEAQEDFIQDLKTIRAVERELAIVGEACYQLRKWGVNFDEQDQAINRRNTLVHQYDAGRPANLWNYVTYRIPILAASVTDLLSREIDSDV